jgi:hypothetical protein
VVARRLLHSIAVSTWGFVEAALPAEETGQRRGLVPDAGEDRVHVLAGQPCDVNGSVHARQARSALGRRIGRSRVDGSIRCPARDNHLERPPRPDDDSPRASAARLADAHDQRLIADRERARLAFPKAVAGGRDLQHLVDETA